MTKRVKRCAIEGCDAKFSNRKHLRNHLRSAHDCFPYIVREAKPVTEGKPQRKIRMMQNSARVKKELEHVTQHAIQARQERLKRAAAQ